MPLTPIAVSAWRTSSSLKGLITATTSFMFRPSFSDSGRSVTPLIASVQVWHLSAPMAQKVAHLTENNYGGELSLASLLYRRGGYPPRCDLAARERCRLACPATCFEPA